MLTNTSVASAAAIACHAAGGFAVRRAARPIPAATLSGSNLHH